MPRLILLNVGVIVDMILAVAMVAIATGAVTEFQFWIGCVGSAADTAFMRIGLLDSAGAICTCGRELDGSRANDGPLLGFADVGSHGKGEQVCYVLAKEKQIVCKADQREEAMGRSDWRRPPPRSPRNF